MDDWERLIHGGAEYAKPVGTILRQLEVSDEYVHYLIKKYYNPFLSNQAAYDEYKQAVINHLKSLGKVEKLLLGLKF